MNCIYTTSLNEKQKQDIRELTASCGLAEPVTLSAPLEDGLSYFLGYDDKELVSMVFLFFPEEILCECGAFTLPAKRRKGYFSALLEKALTEVEAYEKERGLDVDFCFLSDGNSPSADAALQALEAEYWYSEYSMSLCLFPDPTSDPDETASAPSPLLISEAEEHLYTASLDNTPIGVCMVIPNGTSVYFYGFEIKESFRGRGYGHQFLTAMIRHLSNQYSEITLQVSSQNIPALSLYKKTGFRITETLSYYLY